MRISSASEIHRNALCPLPGFPSSCTNTVRLIMGIVFYSKPHTKPNTCFTISPISKCNVIPTNSSSALLGLELNERKSRGGVVIKTHACLLFSILLGIKQAFHLGILIKVTFNHFHHVPLRNRLINETDKI